MGGLISFLCNEPRGHAGMAGALVMDSNRDDADFSVIFFNRWTFNDMCGHATMRGSMCSYWDGNGRDRRTNNEY